MIFVEKILSSSKGHYDQSLGNLGSLPKRNTPFCQSLDANHGGPHGHHIVVFNSVSGGPAPF
jgi:hypothetical protein